jgi:hypothetical protein
MKVGQDFSINYKFNKDHSLHAFFDAATPNEVTDFLWI